MSDNKPPDPPSPAEDSRGSDAAASVQPQPVSQTTPPGALPPQVLAQLMAAAAMRPQMPVPGVVAFPAGQLRVQAQMQWQGQYPPPEAVEHYEKVLPGSFHRMITMAEELQAAQIAESKLALQYTHGDNRRGHWLGFLASALAMAAALGALVFGYQIVAVAFISVPVMGVAKALVDSAKQSSPSEILAAANQPSPPDSTEPSTESAHSPPTA